MPQMPGADGTVRPDRSRDALVSFSCGQLSRSVLWCATDMLIAYHLVERVGFSARAAGAIMFCTLVLSALPDVFVAHWLARRRNPAHAALNLQFGSGVVAAVAAIAMFWPPPAGWYEKVGFVCAASIAFRISYAIYDVSQNSLISLLPQTAESVRRYVTGKTLASSLGRLLASLLLMWALTGPVDPLVDTKVMALIAILVILTCFGLARTRPLARAVAESTPAFRWSSLPFRRLAVPILAITFQVGLLGFISRLLPLYGHGEAGYAQSSTLVIALVCGTVIGPPLVHAVSAHGNGRPLLLAATLPGSAMLTGIALVLPHGAIVSMSLAALYGVTLSGITNLIWERAALVATDHAYAAATRIDGPVFALLTTAIKLAIAASSVIFGFALEGFRSGDSASILVIMIVIVVGGTGTAMTLLPHYIWLPRSLGTKGGSKARALHNAAGSQQ